MTAPLLAFTIALIASITLTAPVRSLALRVGLVDMPGPRKVHAKPIPLLGGLAMYCGIVLGVLAVMPAAARMQTLGIILGATVVGLVGVLDDSGKLHHQIKLFAGMPAAALILLACGVRASFFETFRPGTSWSVIADAALTIFWVVGITASFSIFDHMDGLCAGIAAIGAVFFALYAWHDGQILVTILAAAVAGAAFGFLRWNFKPAKIFMGDAGAMMLGFLMATLSVKLRPVALHHRISWLVPLLILAVPIFDTALVIVSRTRRGFLPFATPGKDHTAHRLSNLGLGQRNAVLALYSFGAIFGAIALTIENLSVVVAFFTTAAILIAMLTGIVLMEQAPYEHQQKKAPAH
jgi:UDP-GlcNAc:undecaprenyl-phosphate/decaprenyl-phosphate GlcNAc-1-phosphate transferase